MPENFTHLHVHTCFSELDGLGKIEDYVLKAKALGMKAMAITDHGSTSGVFAFFNSCQKHGIKPILGTEFYYKTNIGTGHLIALAETNEGLSNIFLLQKYAYTKGMKKKPSVDIDILRRHSKGLIITSACAANPISKSLELGNYSDAYDYATELQDVFGSRFYIEIQSSPDIRQQNLNRQLTSLANKIGAEIVLTNDCHYVEKEDSVAHDVLLAIQTKKKVSYTKRFKFDYDDYYFKDINQIKMNVGVKDEDIERALCNTNIIADMCNVTISYHNDYKPNYKGLTGKFTESTYLAHLADIGYKKKIEGTKWDSDKYKADIQHELSVIDEEGYSGYFLIVQDFINFCRKSNIIVGDGRGSACGSKIGYVTNIHTINPDKYNLLFERFMAKGREPDIDVDVSDRKRVIEYLKGKYGANNVAQVGAESMLTAPVAFKNVASAYDEINSSAINYISKQLHSTWTIDECIEKCKDFAKYAKQYPLHIDVMKRMYGIVRHSSTHAGGVIICEGITELIPVRTIAEDRSTFIACIDKDMAHDLGFTKFDILGLTNLTVIEQAKQDVDSEYELKYPLDLDKLDLDDPEIYKDLCMGDVSGVFQLANQKSMVMQQQPKCFNDLIAINALIRP